MSRPHRVDPTTLRNVRAECADCGRELAAASLLAALAGAGDLQHAGGDTLPCDEREILKGRTGQPLMQRRCTLELAHDGGCAWGPTSRIAA